MTLHIVITEISLPMHTQLCNEQLLHRWYQIQEVNTGLIVGQTCVHIDMYVGIICHSSSHGDSPLVNHDASYHCSTSLVTWSVSHCENLQSESFSNQ